MSNIATKGPVLLVFDFLLGRVRRVQRQFALHARTGRNCWHVRELGTAKFDAAGDFDLAAVELFRAKGEA